MTTNVFDAIAYPGPLPEDPGPVPIKATHPKEWNTWAHKQRAQTLWFENHRKFQLAQAAKELEKIEDPPALVRAVICLAAMVLGGEVSNASVVSHFVDSIFTSGSGKKGE